MYLMAIFQNWEVACLGRFLYRRFHCSRPNRRPQCDGPRTIFPGIEVFYAGQGICM